MHSRIAGLAGLMSLCALAARADDTFPYTAYVTGKSVVCRSGPGEKYYASAELTDGQVVEVYRHDEGAWCAIRPPEGSFSWLEEGHVQPLGDGLGEVIGDQAITRVGGTTTAERDVRQVRLDEGEEIEILDRVTEGQADEQRVWYKIAPPAGEFRWVARADLSRDPPGETSSPEDKRRNLLIDDESPADAGVESPSEPAEGDESTVTPPVAGGWKADRRGPSGKARQAAAMPEPPVEENIVDELDTIDLQISRIVASEPHLWSFDRLKQRTETAKSRAVATADRSRARSLLRRIKRFEDIQQRASGLASTGPGEAMPASAGSSAADDVSIGDAGASTKDDESATILAASLDEDEQSPTTPEQPATPRSPADDRFDGLGRLTRVVSQKEGIPQYALVDEQGQIQQYVTPAPGVNLRRYVGHQVGVNGLRGFIPELNAGHVTAKRVTTMESGRLLR